MKNFVLPPVKKPVLPELSDYLKESMNSFFLITQIPITFFDNEKNICWEWGNSKKLCTYLDYYSSSGCACKKNMQSALEFASKLGEPYVFTCKLGFINIAVSLIIDGKFLGSFVAGPAIPGKLTEGTVNTILETNTLDDDKLSGVIMFLKEVKTYAPKEISNLVIILNNCVLASAAGNKGYISLNKSHTEDMNTGFEMMNNKSKHKDTGYPYELEEQLIFIIGEGDENGALECFIELFLCISTLEFGDFHGIKNRITELFAVVSRSITGTSVDGKYQNGGFFEDMDNLIGAENLDDLKSRGLMFVKNMTYSVFSGIYSGNSVTVAKAIHYMNSNYTSKISLSDIASELHVNQSYLSVLFKKEMKINFSTYLNSIRIKRAKRLLTDTNLSIVDISMQSGFEDQSYFTKIFKKSEKMTPREYRQIK